MRQRQQPMRSKQREEKKGVFHKITVRMSNICRLVSIANGLHRLINAHGVCKCVECREPRHPEKCCCGWYVYKFTAERKVTDLQFKVNCAASSSSSSCVRHPPNPLSSDPPHCLLCSIRHTLFNHIISACMAGDAFYADRSYFVEFSVFVLHESRHHLVCTHTQGAMSTSKQSVFYQFVRRFLFLSFSIGPKRISIAQIKIKAHALVRQDRRRRMYECWVNEWVSSRMLADWWK